MKKKRIALIMSINIMVLIILTMVMAVSAWAADSPSTMETESAPSALLDNDLPITVTLLNVSDFEPYDAFYNGIPVYYDHNEGDQVPYYGGGWIGIDICNNEDAPQSFDVELFSDDAGTPFPPYSDTLKNQNAFMLGKGQNYSVTVPDVPADKCQISYHYIYTPRFKDDPVSLCEIWASSHTRGDCGLQEFFIDVLPTTSVSQTVSGTLVMDPVITAHPGAIEQVVESSTVFTLTVFFESGNLCTASGSCSGSYFPTTYFDYDAGVMHLIRIGAVVTDTAGDHHTATNIMRIEGAAEFTLNQDPIKFVYVFDRDEPYNITFNPSYAASSGSTNYKGNADEVGVPTAITLSDVRTAPVQTQAILVVGMVLLLGAATLVALRRQQQRG